MALLNVASVARRALLMSNMKHPITDTRMSQRFHSLRVKPATRYSSVTTRGPAQRTDVGVLLWLGFVGPVAPALAQRFVAINPPCVAAVWAWIAPADAG